MLINVKIVNTRWRFLIKSIKPAFKLLVLITTAMSEVEIGAFKFFQRNWNSLKYYFKCLKSWNGVNENVYLIMDIGSHIPNIVTTAYRGSENTEIAKWQIKLQF